MLRLPLQLHLTQRAFTQVVLLMATVAFLPDCHGQLKRRAMGTREPRLVWLAKAKQSGGLLAVSSLSQSQFCP